MSTNIASMVVLIELILAGNAIKIPVIEFVNRNDELQKLMSRNALIFLGAILFPIGGQ
jgi:hypothetical protein